MVLVAHPVSIHINFRHSHGGDDHDHDHDDTTPGHSEEHKKSGEFIKSIMFGGMDGIITTFAVVSGATGGGLGACFCECLRQVMLLFLTVNSRLVVALPFTGIDVILILGFSNIIADALSMGVGDALSSKAENEYILRERKREAWEFQNFPEGESTCLHHCTS